MKPAAFDYIAPETVEQAVAALAEHGEDARVMAGGQSLMPILNMRLARPALVVDIAPLGGLDHIGRANGAIEIGANVTQAALMRWPGLGDASPMLAAALPHIGHFQTRNRGTVCGSLCHADPSSELPLCLAVLDGEVVLRREGGVRTVKAGEFQTGMLSTARAADEIMVEARFPVARQGAGHAFRELTRRRGDFAIVALAAVAHGDEIRLGVGGVADRPMIRDWSGLDGDALDDALNVFAWELGGSDDIHATARYRREMVRTIGRRVIEEARAACRS